MFLLNFYTSAVALKTAVRPIPFRADQSDAGIGWVRLIVGLLICLAILAAILFVLRKRMGASIPRKLNGVKIVSQTMLTPGQYLVVVEFGEAQLLLARTKQAVTLLHALPISKGSGESAQPSSSQAAPHQTAWKDK